jgi:hypothetical protein
VAVLLALAGALLGCGSSEPPETPVACLGPPADYLEALEGAPDEALLGGTTPIGACLVEEQSPGTLQTVGASVIATATLLNREVRDDPDPATIARLGYLVGAIQQAGAETGGIHEDLILRLDSAARFSGGEGAAFGASFERAFGKGYAAAQASG